MVSKAALRLRRTKTMRNPESAHRSMPLVILSRADSVLFDVEA